MIAKLLLILALWLQPVPQHDHLWLVLENSKLESWSGRPASNGDTVFISVPTRFKCVWCGEESTDPWKQE
jgi:hypothetical protein